MRRVAVYNQKGGVGKSATTVNVADGLSRRGLQVLVLDLDPQSNTSNTLCKISPKKLSNTMFSLIADPEKPMEECLHETIFEGVQIVPMVMRMRELSVELLRRDTDFLRTRLLKLLQFYPYDAVLIDCPPSLDKLTMMGLTAATHYLVPVKSGDQFGLDGFDDLQATVAEIRREKNPDLQLLGAVLTMHDGRYNINKSIAMQLERLVAGNVFEAAIPDSQKIKEALSRRVSLFALDPKNSAVPAFTKLIDELMQKLGLEDGERAPASEDVTA